MVTRPVPVDLSGGHAVSKPSPRSSPLSRNAWNAQETLRRFDCCYFRDLVMGETTGNARLPLAKVDVEGSNLFSRSVTRPKKADASGLLRFVGWALPPRAPI